MVKPLKRADGFLSTSSMVDEQRPFLMVISALFSMVGKREKRYGMNVKIIEIIIKETSFLLSLTSANFIQKIFQKRVKTLALLKDLEYCVL